MIVWQSCFRAPLRCLSQPVRLPDPQAVAEDAPEVAMLAAVRAGTHLADACEGDSRPDGPVVDKLESRKSAAGDERQGVA